MTTARRVVCTGVGMVSPLGVGAEKSWTLLRAGRSGLRTLKSEHSFEGCKSRVAAYVPDDEYNSELALQKHYYLTRNAKQLSRATTYAMIASHEALDDARLLDETTGQIHEPFRERCGVAIGQGMVDFVDIYENGKLVMPSPDQDGPTKRAGFRKLSPYFMTRALINMSAGNVSIRYKPLGPNHCVSTACATGAHSLGDAFSFIKCGKADLMIAGSTEASVNSIAMAGFERLRALCTDYNEQPTQASRPFDKARAGFVMGEGAGIVILEELGHAKRRGLSAGDFHCELLGYGVSSDGHHATAPLPDGGGALRCMRAALQEAGFEGTGEVSHVNAHATSTPLGDDIECNAIEQLFGATEALTTYGVSVTSCKGAMGHLLGGAGSVETIFAMLSCRDALLPPTLNLVEPLETERNFVRFVRGTSAQPWSQPASWRRVLLKNSFGFGGTNASLVVASFVA